MQEEEKETELLSFYADKEDIVENVPNYMHNNNSSSSPLLQNELEYVSHFIGTYISQ